MGDEYILQFSPWNVVSQQSARISNKGFNKQENYWDIMGVSILDYLDLYRKHTFVRRESYKLDYIGEVELGENKHENPYDTFQGLNCKINSSPISLLNLFIKKGMSKNLTFQPVIISGLYSSQNSKNFSINALSVAHLIYLTSFELLPNLFLY